MIRIFWYNTYSNYTFVLLTRLLRLFFFLILVNIKSIKLWLLNGCNFKEILLNIKTIKQTKNIIFFNKQDQKTITNQSTKWTKIKLQPISIYFAIGANFLYKRIMCVLNPITSLERLQTTDTKHIQTNKYH